MSVFAKTPQGNSIVKIGKGKYLSKNWYLKLHKKGKTTYWSLFEGKGESAKRADHIKAFLKLPGKGIPEMRAEFYGQATVPLPSPSSAPAYATIGECLDCLVKHHKTRLKPVTLKNYLTGLHWVVRGGQAVAAGKKFPERRTQGSSDAAYRKLSTSILTPQLAADFKEGFVGKASPGEAQLSAKRSANTWVAQAKAVFSKKALREYKIRGLSVPDLSGFLSTDKFDKMGKRYAPPPDMVVSQIIGWADKGNDPEREKAVILALWFGLRREEIIVCRWSWLGNEGKVTVQAAGEFVPKGTYLRTIENPAAWRRIFALAAPEDMDGEEATVLKGGVMQRTAAAQRALAYAKFHGLKERKPLHELRKLYGCLRRTDTKDIFLVQRELGHASPETTDSYYASARMSPTMVALWKEKYP